MRACQGLLQKDGVIQYVLQAEQGAFGVGDIQPHCGEPPAVYPLQEAPVHRRVTLLDVIAKPTAHPARARHCYATCLAPAALAYQMQPSVQRYLFGN